MSEKFYFTRLFELKERVKDTTTIMMASPLDLRGGGGKCKTHLYLSYRVFLREFKHKFKGGNSNFPLPA